MKRNHGFVGRVVRRGDSETPLGAVGGAVSLGTVSAPSCSKWRSGVIHLPGEIRITREPEVDTKFKI